MEISTRNALLFVVLWASVCAKQQVLRAQKSTRGRVKCSGQCIDIRRKSGQKCSIKTKRRMCPGLWYMRCCTGNVIENKSGKTGGNAPPTNPNPNPQNGDTEPPKLGDTELQNNNDGNQIGKNIGDTELQNNDANEIEKNGQKQPDNSGISGLTNVSTYPHAWH